MRTAYSLGSLLTIHEILECAKIISKTDADTVWIPETWGMENFSMLGIVSQIARNCNIGSSIINVYSRSPAVIAMGAVTLDTVSCGRLILGLGASSVPIVEKFHGYRFEKPVGRTREYVEIIRKITSSGQASHSGDMFKLRNFSLLIKPFRPSIPIYLAAVNKRMVELAWDVADGVIFYLRPLAELERTIREMQSRRKIDVACQIITSVAMDSDAAIARAKKTVAFYISVGKIYREFLKQNGFASEAEAVHEEFKKSGLESNYKLIPDSMLDSLAIAGTPEDCKGKLERFRRAGVCLPIIQFNPVGDAVESFKLLAETFSEVVR